MPAVDFSLYLITDRRQTAGRPLVPLLRQAVRAGLRAIQFRERDLADREWLALAGEAAPFLHEAGCRLLVNDRADLALALQADGLHLRSDGLPVPVARRLVGSGRLIGVSAHSVEEVVRAEAEGADFAVLGPVYDTPSKRGYGAPIGLSPIAEARRRCRMPVFAIGGVTTERVREVREAGAAGVAVVSAILSAPDVDAATRALLTALVR